MKKIGIGLFSLILINLICLLALSFNCKKILINGVIKEVIKEKIVAGDITENIEIEDKEKVKELLESKETEELLNKYLDKVLEGISGEEDIDEVELKKDIINYLKENKEELSKISGQEITDEMIDRVEQELNEKEIDKSLKESINTTSKNIPTQQKKLIKGFNTFNSTKFKVIIFISIILTIVVIALIQKSLYMWIKTVGKSMATSGILLAIMSLIVRFIVTYFSPLKSFNTNSLLETGIGLIVFGILMVVIFKIINKSKVIENEVS